MSEFQKFLDQLVETNATLDYFVSFDTVRKNVSKIALKLNQLNYLIGKSNLKEAIRDIYNENPKAFDVLGILIAVRESNKTKTFNNQGEIVFVDSYFSSLEGIYDYIQQTGLEKIFQNKDITNLVDYVFGVEAGLSTHGRKNRGGDNMNFAVAKQLENANIPFLKEVPNTNFPDITGLGKDIKRFDFVIKTKLKTYLIETNFYNTGGSKPNEVARAYSDIAPKINRHPNYEFVWITDGQGWQSAKNKLEEAFNNIPSIYNLTTLERFIAKLQDEGFNK